MATDEGKCRKQLNYLIDQVSALSISNIQICWQVQFNFSVSFVAKMKHFVVIFSFLVPITHSVSACWQRPTEIAEGRPTLVQCSLPGTCSLNHWPSFWSSARTTCMCHSLSPFTALEELFPNSKWLNCCFRPNSAHCPVAGTTAQDVWETSVPLDRTGPLQDSTRPTFNDFTTRRSNNFVWQTTYKPWYPGIRSNSLDSPKQQGLFSSACKSAGNLLLFLSILFVSLLV